MAPPPSQAEPVYKAEEWYGLEYTLELSRRDRQGSNSYDQNPVGEHSKVDEPYYCIER